MFFELFKEAELVFTTLGHRNVENTRNIHDVENVSFILISQKNVNGMSINIIFLLQPFWGDL